MHSLNWDWTIEFSYPLWLTCKPDNWRLMLCLYTKLYIKVVLRKSELIKNKIIFQSPVRTVMTAKAIPIAVPETSRRVLQAQQEHGMMHKKTCYQLFWKRRLRPSLIVSRFWRTMYIVDKPLFPSVSVFHNTSWEAMVQKDCIVLCI